jgi:hypothetical protein
MCFVELADVSELKEPSSESTFTQDLPATYATGENLYFSATNGPYVVH